MTRYCIFETAAGFCAIAWSELGVVRFQLPLKSPQSADRLLLRRAPEATPGGPPAEISEAIDAAKRYFAGEETDFSSVGLDLGDKDALFRQIYDAARRIGWGQTTTYGALAKDIGAGSGGCARRRDGDGADRVPLIIPCHRVLAAGGKVGGFSAPGGAATKIRMLKLEALAPRRLSRFSGPSRSEFLRPQMRHSPSSVRPGWSSGRRPCGQRNRRSDSAIRTSLMLAWRSAR